MFFPLCMPNMAKIKSALNIVSQLTCVVLLCISYTVFTCPYAITSISGKNHSLYQRIWFQVEVLHCTLLFLTFDSPRGYLYENGILFWIFRGESVSILGFPQLCSIMAFEQRTHSTTNAAPIPQAHHTILQLKCGCVVVFGAAMAPLYIAVPVLHNPALTNPGLNKPEPQFRFHSAISTI